MNPDGLSVVLDGEDAVVKMWSQNGILRTNLASVGGAVASCNWCNTGKDLVFTYRGTVMMRSASLRQDQMQFWALWGFVKRHRSVY
jgi:hypothetical protein